MSDDAPHRRADDQPPTTIVKMKDRTIAIAFLGGAIAFLYQMSEILMRHSAWSDFRTTAGVGEILFAAVMALLTIGAGVGLDLSSLVRGFKKE